MSAEGQTYVEKYSPYEGTTYQIHLRLGLLSNDAHDFKIFCGDQYLAEMCRCSVKSVQRAKAELIRDGFLKMTRPATGRQVAEYVFIFNYGIGGQGDRPQEIGGQMGPNRWTSRESSPINRNEVKEGGEAEILEFKPVDHRRHAERLRALVKLQQKENQ